jgi:hypothetical protein
LDFLRPNEKIGLSYGPESMLTLGRRLRERLVLLKLATFAEYYQHSSWSARSISLGDLIRSAIALA